jgi:prevent-host-death family protein
MQTVTVKQARQELARLLDSVEQGQSVAITRRGRQVAQLVPPPAAGGRRLPDMREFRATLHPRGKPLSQIVIERRRQERY